MESMQVKRPAYEADRTGSSHSTYSCVDEELQQRLASVGPRARKHVSDGHQTPGTSIPSFSGLAVGTLDQNQLRQEMGARPVQSMEPGSTGGKRSFSNWEAPPDADEYGDTEDDEETFNPNVHNANLNPQQNNTFATTYSSSGHTHASFFPNGHRSRSSHQDDFEEATFLQPRK